MLYTNHSQFTRTGPNSTEPARPGSRFMCATCWRIAPATHEGSFSNPYGIDTAGGLHCLECCHWRDLQRMRDRSGPFACYVSTGGRTVSNWPGSILGHVVASSSHRNNLGARVHCYTVRDAHGAHWHGRNAGPGRCITLRPSRA